MKKYRKPGTCDMCFFGWDLDYSPEATCGWHEGKLIKRGQLKCNQFYRRDAYRRK